jgi:cell division protein FtsZ
LDLSVADLSEAQLSEANLRRSDLSAADLTAANLIMADLNGANLYEANFTLANLVGVDLRGANLSWTNLSWADLSKADLSKADLSGANLSWAKLGLANLSKADLSRVDLSGADLSGADLSGADFSGATLMGTHLSGANISDSQMSDTVMGNIDLSNVIGLGSIYHMGPSTLGIDTLILSQGKIPEVFLRGCGVPDIFVNYGKSQGGKTIQFFSCFISYSNKDQEFARYLYNGLQSEGVRCWFAPEDARGGSKLHEQIAAAIGDHDKLLLILSPASMASEWVKTEIAKARKRENDQGRQMLFPVSLVSFQTLQGWECFDADVGKDSAREIREYFIPDFSEWKTDPDKYKRELSRLLRDLKADSRSPMRGGVHGIAAAYRRVLFDTIRRNWPRESTNWRTDVVSPKSTAHGPRDQKGDSKLGNVSREDAMAPSTETTPKSDDAATSGEERGIREVMPNNIAIKVIGIGGAGGNVVDHMIRSDVPGVEFIAMNTDAHALAHGEAKNQIQLGASGRGAGATPEAGHAAALEAREQIKEALVGAHMVFITAGMGGGTGTGAAPLVAEVAKQMGILTVAVVTKPFSFEGVKRMRAAEDGIDELAQNVDSVIVILNEKLEEVLGEEVSMEEAFSVADDVLKSAVAGISEIINIRGLINVDFQDVKTVMHEQGMAMMGSASASGIDRAHIAAEQAVACPLLEGVNLSGARGVLVNITAAKSGLKLRETKEVMETIRSFAAEDATVILGAVYDEQMGDELRVTVVATGLGQPAAIRQTKPQSEIENRTDTLPTTGVDYAALDAMSAVIRKNRASTIEALQQSGMDKYDIPAFLRRQAD